MTSAGPDEGRTTPDLSSWREFAIDGEFCVAEARLETQESLDQYTPACCGHVEARWCMNPTVRATRTDLLVILWAKGARSRHEIESASEVQDEVPSR